MNEVDNFKKFLIGEFKKKFRNAVKFMAQEGRVYNIIQTTLAMSAVSLVYFIFYLRKKNKFVLVNIYANNLGFLRLVKPNINRYHWMTMSKNITTSFLKNTSPNLNRLIKKFYSIPNGLTNLGNNCYINVLLQCLASNPDFILFMKHFLETAEAKNLDKKDLHIVEDLEDVLARINSENSVITPYNLVNNINNKFAFEHEQQDSYELYHRLLEIFDSNVEIGNSDRDINQNMNVNFNCNPFLIDWESKLKCKKCSNVITVNEKSMDISLTPDNMSFSVSVNQLIDKVFKPSEITDYVCSKCTVKNIISQIESKLSNLSRMNPLREKYETLNGYLKDISADGVNITKSVEIVVKDIVDFCDEKGCNEVLENLKLNQVKSNLAKYMEIKKFPKILTVHVHSVFYQEHVVTNKVKMVFPEKLAFPENSDNKYNISLNQRMLNYELKSFIEHFGNHSFGHYIAYRKFYGKWFLINDSHVKMIDRQIALDVGSPYVLFYRLTDNL